MSKSLKYFGLGSGIYVVGMDGILIKVPGSKLEREKNKELDLNRYIEGEGKYKCPDTYILFHISKLNQQIILTVGRKFTEAQQRTLNTFCTTHAPDMVIDVFACGEGVKEDVNKFQKTYNLIAKA